MASAIEVRLQFNSDLRVKLQNIRISMRLKCDIKYQIFLQSIILWLLQNFPPLVFLYFLVTIGAIMMLLLRGTLVNNHESIKETASNNDCLMQIFLGRHPPRTI